MICQSLIDVAVIVEVVVVTTVVATMSRNSHSRVCSDGNGRGSSDSSVTHCNSMEAASAAAVPIESAKTAAASYRIPYF